MIFNMLLGVRLPGAEHRGLRVSFEFWPLGSTGCLVQLLLDQSASCLGGKQGWKALVFLVDDEHVREDDGHPGGAAQEPQHQGVAGPHAGLGHDFQVR